MKKIINKNVLDFDDVLIVPKLGRINSRSEVSLTIKNTDKIPIIASNMDTVGTISMAKKMAEHGMFTAIHKFIDNKDIYNEIHNIQDYFFYTIGIRDEDIKRLYEYTKNYGTLKNICIDVANGYIPNFLKVVRLIRKDFPHSLIMAGNVVTPEGVRAVSKAGADIVKIGIGSGNVCSTRLITGVGYPQLSAILECKKVGVPICSDGGCRHPGDIAKAFAAGADFVMLGSMLAGHDECEQDVICNRMPLYGMGSARAMRRYYGGVAHYRATEGIETTVEYKGSVENTISQILGGLRSSFSYVGAKNLKEFYKKSQLIIKY